MKDRSQNFYYLDNKLYMDRSEDTYRTLSTVFRILTELSWPEITVYTDNMTGITSKKKNPEHIVKLDFDFLPLHDKFVLWHLEEISEKTERICFADDELELIKRCCNAAYYYYISQGYKVLSIQDRNHLAEFFNFLFEKNEFGLKP